MAEPRSAEPHTYVILDASGSIVAEFPDIGQAVEFRNECAHPGEHLRVTMMSAVCCDQVECWSALARAADGRDGDMYAIPMDDDDA